MFSLAFLLSLLFGFMALAKLTNRKAFREQFDTFGLSLKTMYFVGSLELIGVIGLNIKGLEGYAAMLLTAIVFGAIYKHFRADHHSKFYFPALLAIVLLTLYLLNYYALI